MANVPITPHDSPLPGGYTPGSDEDGTPMEINMLIEKKYLLIKELLKKMLNLQLEAEEESTMEFELIKFIKSMLEEFYHALIEALIEDENAMDKGVADTVKDHKRKHDDDDEDDNDKVPPAGPNQSKKIKRRRTKESESSKKPSITKET
ncbi:hypothetical protein Tco_0860166 [Tanacetum coccineum]|uniref:Uncharacterized protein n=1 Tax=Tanacetum coccineum TaxID=301880 RepID=A0ABQ5BI50_9ASTR